MCFTSRYFKGAYELKFVFLRILELVMSWLPNDQKFEQNSTEVVFEPFLDPKIFLICILWIKNEFLLRATIIT